MRKTISILLMVVMAGMLLAGCGKGKSSGHISNDVISIEGYKELEVKQASEEAVWEVLLANCEVVGFPEEELQELKADLELQYGYVAEYNGQTASELIEEQEGMSLQEYAEYLLTKKYAAALIAEEEGLTLSSEEYEQMLQERASEGGVDDPLMYEDMFGREELEQMFLEERVEAFLTEHLKS